jgi:hypothetical protein
LQMNLGAGSQPEHLEENQRTEVKEENADGHLGGFTNTTKGRTGEQSATTEVGFAVIPDRTRRSVRLRRRCCYEDDASAYRSSPLGREDDAPLLVPAA